MLTFSEKEITMFVKRKLIPIFLVTLVATPMAVFSTEQHVVIFLKKKKEKEYQKLIMSVNSSTRKVIYEITPYKGALSLLFNQHKIMPYIEDKYDVNDICYLTKDDFNNNKKGTGKLPINNLKSYLSDDKSILEFINGENLKNVKFLTGAELEKQEAKGASIGIGWIIFIVCVILAGFSYLTLKGKKDDVAK
ncbi:MAG: hypothetical protein AAF335_04475 [Bacteroidota bacterium]